MYPKEKTLRIDKEHIWHPFTQMKDFENRDHTVIVKGKGTKIWDADGNEYYDTISSWWCNSLGHSNKRINKAIKKQLKKIEHINFSGFTHPYAAEMIDRLNDFMPDKLSKYFFSDNGSTAVEVAVKMAFQYWKNQGREKKSKFAMLANAYHGDTIGAVSVSGVDEYHKLYKPLMFQTYGAECPVRENIGEDFTFDAKNLKGEVPGWESMEKVLRKHQDELAAVIVEPLLMGAGGMIVYPPEYLKKLRALSKELDILLIFDEVATGFGRTGTMFAMEQAEVVPDIICLSKALTAGYMPLSLTVTNNTVYQAFYDDYKAGKTFFHGHSYTANPLACAVAIENLKILKEMNLPYSKKDVLDLFHQELRSFADNDSIADIRYQGFVGAIDIIKSRSKKESFGPDVRIGQEIYQESLKNGIVLRPLGDTIYFWLPLIIKKKEIIDIMRRTRKTLDAVLKKHI